MCSRLRTLNHLSVISTLVIIFISCTNQIYHLRSPAGDFEVSSAKTAFEVYSELQESVTTFNSRAIMVDGDLAIDGIGARVTRGSEKEASSGLITRVMGQTGEDFKHLFMI